MLPPNTITLKEFCRRNQKMRRADMARLFGKTQAGINKIIDINGTNGSTYYVDVDKNQLWIAKPV